MGGMEIGKALWRANACAGFLRVFLEFFVAFGIDDNDGLIPFDGLTDEQIVKTGFAGARGTENQGLTFQGIQRQENVSFLTQRVYPGFPQKFTLIIGLIGFEWFNQRAPGPNK